MSLAILKNEESDEGVNSTARIDNLAFLSWLTDEETIRDEGAIAGKIKANPEPTIQLIDKYHDWQYLQFAAGPTSSSVNAVIENKVSQPTITLILRHRLIKKNDIYISKAAKNVKSAKIAGLGQRETCTARTLDQRAASLALTPQSAHGPNFFGA